MSEIRIENLNKKIKGSVILDDISLTMTPGRIYGLRGKNGCGMLYGHRRDVAG